jgi:hypothetical protein
VRDQAKQERLDNKMPAANLEPDPGKQAELKTAAIDEFRKDTQMNEPSFPVPDSGSADSASSGSGGANDSAGDQGAAKAFTQSSLY